MMRVESVAVADVEWEPVLAAGAAAAGGVAALACRAAPASAPLDHVLWYRGDHLIDVETPRPGKLFAIFILMD